MAFSLCWSQCTLASLEWRVYGADPASSHAASATVSSTPPPTGSAHDADAVSSVVKKEKLDQQKQPVDAGADDALHALFRRLQQQNSLVVQEEPASKDANDSSDDAAQVWLFMVNNGNQEVPTADTLAGIVEVTSGAWRKQEEPEAQQELLDVGVQKRFFRALNTLMSRKLLANAEFVLEQDFFQPNDAKFIYRCPSLSLLNHFDIYLDEDLPTPAFQLHFQLMVPSQLVCVTASMVMRERFARASGELGDPESSWQRLLGLPCGSDHSMVDVWHLDDGLVPRIIAETKYSDVYARFRAVAKRKNKRKNEEGDGAGNEGDDGSKKAEENDDDGDDDEEDAAHDGEGDGDDLRRRVTPGKKRRKKTSADPAENDESVTPVSPDTHVNTPDASGPTIRVTFPHDPDTLLHYDAEVNHFKRRRNPQKKKDGAVVADFALVFGSASYGVSGLSASSAKRPSVAEYANLVKSTATTPTHLLSQSRKNSLATSGLPSATPRSEAKPTLSVAVSLVASLSHDEQQEALDGRPTKTHPLLAALQSFVESEFNAKTKERNQRGLPTKQHLLPNAETYVSTKFRKPSTLLGVNAATTERLRNNLLSDRFKAWTSDYSPHQYHNKTKHQKKERQRQLLLHFDESKLDEYSRQKAQTALQTQDLFQPRDEEIALGVHMAASDALVAWRQVSGNDSRWLLWQKPGARVATTREKKSMADRIQPHLLSLRSLLHGKAADGRSSRDQWLKFKEYAKESSRGNGVEARNLPAPPKFCVSTLESGLHVEPQLISEYLLRGFHPVAAPKPVDYAIVCPHSPSEWLGILALSYLTCFRSMYAQCHMGDHAPIDLAQMEGNSNVSVDASNALLLVECATSAYDAFATYRSAGELLSPLLCNGVKKKQAFSRSAVANVIYVVVPFRRQDLKHKMWALGAFSHGLFGSTSPDATSWKDSVTIELLYLEDLYEVGVNPNPFVLMPNCFALYDRVFESVSLKPIITGSDQGVPFAPPATGKSRYVSERLYHLADAAGKSKEGVPLCAYAGYAISEDQKWIACSCVDAVGSVLETFMVSLDDADLERAFLEMMKKWLDFIALFGEESSLVVCRLSESSTALSDNELNTWRELSANRPQEFVPTSYAPLLTDIKVVDVVLASREEVQVRENDFSMLYSSERSGCIVVSPYERVGGPEGSRGACYANGSGSNLGSFCVPRSQRGKKETATVNVSIVLDQLLLKPDSEDNQPTPSEDMSAILNDFHSLSYLTMHPITMERRSPLPLHLSVVDKVTHELSSLATQLRTDPLERR